MAAARSRLVTDRLEEFRSLAQSKRTLATQAQTPVRGGFMREFFDSVNKIQTTLNEGRVGVKQMGEALEEALQATTQEKQQAASARLQALVERTNGHLTSVRDGIQRLKASSEEEERRNASPAEGRIRANMQQALTKKHQQLLLDSQQAQIDFKQALERRQAREMEILMPEASAEERAEMIEAGETTAVIVAKRMAGAHAMLLDEVQRIRDKHQDIVRLERSIAELAQMFTEMATLVEEQGEMLDAIEAHVHDTKGYTAKAEKELQTTRKAQRNTQKWMCCLSVFLLIVMLCVMAPVLIKRG